MDRWLYRFLQKIFRAYRHVGGIFQDMHEEKYRLISYKINNVHSRSDLSDNLTNKDRYKIDPASIQGLQSMHIPKIEEYINKIIHCLRWTSDSIPNFEYSAAHLTKITEKYFKKSEKRTKRLIRSLYLIYISLRKNINTYIELAN